MRNEKGQFVKGSIPTNAFPKGHIPWSKGMKRPGFGFQPGHETSEEIREKLRLANLGENSPNFGKHHSTGTIQKQSETKLGEKNPNWNGGRKKSYGYVLILKPEHPFNIAGYVREHRLVMEEFLGRYLLPKEVVHHENEIRDDNSLENLRLFENDGKHTAYHHEQNRLAIAI